MPIAEILGSVLASAASGAASSAISNSMGGSSGGTQAATESQVPGPGGDLQKQIGGIAQKLGGRGADALIDRLFGRHEARTMGMRQKEFFDAFAPDTTQWEQIGSPHAGGTQQAITKQQTRSQEKIAKMQIEGQKEVARIQTAPAMGQLGVSERHLVGQLEALDAQSQSNIADAFWRYQLAKTEGEKYRTERAYADLAEQLAQADLVARENTNATTTIINAMEDGISGDSQDIAGGSRAIAAGAKPAASIAAGIAANAATRGPLGSMARFLTRFLPKQKFNKRGGSYFPKPQNEKRSISKTLSDEKKLKRAQNNISQNALNQRNRIHREASERAHKRTRERFGYTN